MRDNGNNFKLNKVRSLTRYYTVDFNDDAHYLYNKAVGTFMFKLANFVFTSTSAMTMATVKAFFIYRICAPPLGGF